MPVAASAQRGTLYSWVDDEGIRHYGDSIPAEYADKPKQVVNEHGVTVGHIEGRKTAEQLEAERVAQELATEIELQKRADQALLATYIDVNEIEMHRDRRVELFQAQARVTELYLRNLRRRLDQLRSDAGRFKPYNSDPGAPTIDPTLVEDINDTEAAIARHESNLKKYRQDEQQIKERFQIDINRFMALKGITMTTAQTVPE
ncbi:MAG: DUF4124 domain-containing protein [Gammaproteobacteria bacterium]|nr:DUF4124 domain-containing protein [Gammaproteobacteria bacterium]MDH3433665.1 DUF4124 domain-containing protein [Gammaproteobacteria bacterium]